MTAPRSCPATVARTGYLASASFFVPDHCSQRRGFDDPDTAIGKFDVAFCFQLPQFHGLLLLRPNVSRLPDRPG